VGGVRGRHRSLRVSCVLELHAHQLVLQGRRCGWVRVVSAHAHAAHGSPNCVLNLLRNRSPQPAVHFMREPICH
jgi:hypothetical protein